MNRQPNKPFVVGLTGGVASGKSAVAQSFQSLGVPVIDTDRLAREVVRPGSEALAELVDAFGEHILTEDGELDRRCMRETVFADEAARRRVETILHPRIANRLEQRLEQVDAPYCVVAIPLLVEAGWTGRVDRILVVDVPESMQVSRVMDRDGIDAQAAQKMLQAQSTREERLEVADDVLDNTGDMEDLDALVGRLHAAYTAIATTVT